jgi:hypothetical protein
MSMGVTCGRLRRAQGLYPPKFEHDGCRKGIQILIRLAHRGACGCNPETGNAQDVVRRPALDASDKHGMTR